MISRHHKRLSWAFAGVLMWAANANADRYLLVVPNAPQVRSYATVAGSLLTLEHDGRTYRYVRRPLLDTADGRYRGYHSLTTGRRIRFPAQGRGKMLIRDRQQRLWRPSRMVVSPLPTVRPAYIPAYPSLPHSGFGPVVIVAPPTHVVKYVANPPLAPAVIQLRNSHREDLIVGVIDRRNPNQPARQILVKGKSAAPLTVDRDPGGTMVSMLVDSTGRPTQILDRVPVPPKTYYDLAVYEYKIVSTYYDRTLPGAAKFKPISQRKGTRSLGVFPLSAGGNVVTGSQLNVYDSAVRAGNPGAVRLSPALRGLDR